MSAQVFLAGSTQSCVTVFVNKTFAPIATGPCFGCTLTTDSYSFAITGTPLTSITVTSYFYENQSVSAWSKQKKLYVSSTNNVEFVEGVNCVGPMCSKLSSTTALNPSLNWQNNSSDIYKEIWGTFPSYTCGIKANPHYIGFRKILTNDTIYGWISLNTNWPGGINSYAFIHTGTATVTPVFTTTMNTICAASTLTLDATPQGGLFSGPGVSGNVFTHTIPGPHTVYYTTNCYATASLNITVDSLPNAVITNTESIICKDDTVTLAGTPVGGTFTGTGVSGNTFIPPNQGGYYVFYSCTGLNGCSETVKKLISVSACVGINELKNQEAYIKIFPNPNNGEFEIKGEKETSLIITNELGQIVKKIELNAANNFSSKITELQSGVYFIGNNYLRQKIVVIQ